MLQMADAPGFITRSHSLAGQAGSRYVMPHHTRTQPRMCPHTPDVIQHIAHQRLREVIRTGVPRGVDQPSHGNRRAQQHQWDRHKQNRAQPAAVPAGLGAAAGLRSEVIAREGGGAGV